MQRDRQEQGRWGLYDSSYFHVSTSSTPQWIDRWGSRAARCRRSAAWRACRWPRRACSDSCRCSRWSGRRSCPAERAPRRSPPGRRSRAARRWSRRGCSCGSAADEEGLRAVINGHSIREFVFTIIYFPYVSSSLKSKLLIEERVLYENRNLSVLVSDICSCITRNLDFLEFSRNRIYEHE